MEFQNIDAVGGSSGIGLAIALDLLESGAKVVIADLQGPKPESLVKLKALKKENDWTFLQCNITSWESQVNVFQGTVDKFGRLDYFYANAGVSETPPFLLENAGRDELTKPNLAVYDVNLTGTLQGISQHIRTMFYLHYRHLSCGASLPKTKVDESECHCYNFVKCWDLRFPGRTQLLCFQACPRWSNKSVGPNFDSRER